MEIFDWGNDMHPPARDECQHYLYVQRGTACPVLISSGLTMDTPNAFDVDDFVALVHYCGPSFSLLILLAIPLRSHQRISHASAPRRCGRTLARSILSLIFLTLV